MRDHELDYPELWMEVFVSPDPAVRDDEARFAQMFARSRCSRAKSVLEADLVVFAGGTDVDPALYGEEPHVSTCFNRARDDTDTMLYNLCVENGIPMLGVCRGAQFLHVMNGGKLYQDIDKHYGDHRMYVVDQKDFIDKVSSVHHQACIPQHENGFRLLGSNGDARNRRLNPSQSVLGPRADVEAFFYRDTCCLGVQGHPEYQGYNRFTKWVLDQINSLILCSPDIEWRDGQRRVRLELLEERKLLASNLIIPEENV
jgi:GMP synthase-like glutamine amidotransferase